EADILLTDQADVALAIQTADCVPLLLADRRLAVVCAAHAGWRGLAAAVPRVAVETLRGEFGSQPTDLVAAIGPSICAARYEVGQDVLDRFTKGAFTGHDLSRWFPAGQRAAHWQFDGARSAHDQLAAAGVPAEQIHASGLCTLEHDELFASYR